MKLALAQINTTVGDFAGNQAKIEEACGRAAERGAGLVLFPELTLNGYPPRDLLRFAEFVAEGEARLEELGRILRGGPAALVGLVARHEQGPGTGLSNALAWLYDGKVQALARKTLLPNYDVFDERRYFDPAASRTVVLHEDIRVGLSICEDLWNDARFWAARRYSCDPADDFEAAGCRWILNASASPFESGKVELRQQMVAAIAARRRAAIAVCNLVGGNDSLIFDGNSFVVDADGQVVARAAGFAEELLVVDPSAFSASAGEATPAPIPEAELLDALVLGLRDYVRKVGFRRAVLGLSGGIDSALTAVIAARALGPENVLAVALPSRFTAAMSDDDAARLAANLGIEFARLPVESVLDSLEGALRPLFAGAPRDVTEENLQARTRGTLLMAISNKSGRLLLATGNKSELSVGYCTLYGDMNGALSVIGDLSKTQVYRLTRFLNRDREVIPRRILERPPSAELREDQKDEDSLPPYDELDRILEGVVVERQSVARLLQAGHRQDVVQQVHRLLIRSEYKRRQAAPSLKVSPSAFGEGWRFPIAHAWDPTHLPTHESP